jgi:hypothetical protein
LPLPPDAVTVTVELPPWQRIAVAVAAAVTAEGSVIVMEVVDLQPFASLTV